jgi:oligoendopeptidase F
MSEKDSWDLSRIIKDRDELYKMIDGIKKNDIPALTALKGKLGTEDGLKVYLDLNLKLEKNISFIGAYTSMASDLNKKDVKRSEDDANCSKLISDIVEADSFASPEIIGLGKDYIEKFLKSHKEYDQFDFYFEKLFRNQEHILDAEKEKLLAAYSTLSEEGASLYSSLTVGDSNPAEIQTVNGQKLKVTQGNWRNLVADSADPEDRRRISQAIYSYYEGKKNTYGEIYNTVLQSELALMKARGYSSILEEHLYNNKIPSEVFMSLIKTTSTHAEPVKKYIELKKKYLGLKEYHTYDRFVQLSKSDKKITLDEAKDNFFRSISRFPSDFQEKGKEVLSEGYVDVYEKDGKRSGAYSSGGEGVHPYILFNFSKDGLALDDNFTLAHESGHSIHTLYATESQPLMKQNYTIFVAEIASTFNEHNLLDYFMTSGKLDKAQKIMLLQKSIDDIVSTFYRQALFAQFEYEISLKAQAGEPINYQVCCDKMVELYKTYYGLDLTKEDSTSYVWAYIPHIFYTPFYVYQYATSFTASMQLYANVKANKPQAFEKYIGLLKSGGSDFPVEEVKKAGVDLTDPASFMSVVKRAEELVDELEKILKE